MDDETEHKQSVGDVLRGLTFLEPDPEQVSGPQEAYFLIKSKDPQGRILWGFRATPGLADEELLGALRVHIGLLREELLDEWRN